LSDEEQANIMADFNLDDKTQEISQLLEDNPQTLQATFIQLTSEVEYADFWKRYYCRLGGEDEKKIEATFAKYYEEPEPGPSALSSVTNFFGVAVARLVDEEETEEAIAPNPFFNRTGKASAKSALGFLTGGGRPPFVLNTALSDDDDEEYVGGQQQQEESEDEEDLGWDEDSDDEEDDHDNDYNDNDNNDDGSEVVMEFKDTEKEALKEKLEQAMEERKQLQNTIEMQAAEIKELQVKGTEGSGGNGGSGGGGEEQAEDSASAVPAAEGASAPDEAFKKDLEDLKVELFEREAEVAGLKLKMEDNNLENMHIGRKKLRPSQVYRHKWTLSSRMPEMLMMRSWYKANTRINSFRKRLLTPSNSCKNKNLNIPNRHRLWRKPKQKITNSMTRLPLSKTNS